MASTSGGIVYHRNGSSARFKRSCKKEADPAELETSIIFLAQSGPVGNHRTRTHPFAVVLRSTTTVPVEHLQTIQSGLQTTDWEDCRNVGSNWFKRNDSDKAQYVGSAANLPLKRRLQKKVGLCDFRRIDVWRAVAVELAATAALTFLSISVSLQSGTSSKPTMAILQGLVYSFATLAAAPISGGHLNPAITFTTLLTGQASLIRSVLYMVAQSLGAILAAVAIRGMTDEPTRTTYHMGGCLLHQLPDSTTSSGLGHGQGFFAEVVFTSIMLFVVYGVGFDSRSVVVTFPVVSPFVIGSVFGFLGLISQGLGYTAQMNPARCIGPAAVYHSLWDPLLIFISGPLLAAIAVGLFQILLHQVDSADSGPVLPLNFFQVVTPDHHRPGFGPRSPQPHYPAIVDHVESHSQRIAPGRISGLLQPVPPQAVTSSDPMRISEKMSLVLQIRAVMQPATGAAEDLSSRSSTANIVDVQRSDRNLMMLQQQQQQQADQHSPPSACIEMMPVLASGDPEKDR